MRTEELRARLKEFVEECGRIIDTKNPDYNPDGQAFGDLISAQTEMGTPVEIQLYHLMRKHWAAITTYMKNGRLESETIQSRLRDLANYAGLLAAWLEDNAGRKLGGEVYVSGSDGPTRCTWCSGTGQIECHGGQHTFWLECTHCESSKIGLE